MGHVRRADAQAARQQQHGVGAPCGLVPELGQRRVGDGNGPTGEQARHQGRDLVHAEKRNGLVDRLGGPAAAKQGRVGQF